MDAFRENSYRKIRVGGDFQRVMCNTLRLIELKKSLNKRIKVMVSAINQPIVKDELLDFKRYWKKRADIVIIRTLTSIGGLVKNKKLHYSDEERKKRWPCPLLWRRLFINVDGHAEFCVDDWLDQSIVADVREKSIAEIWAGDSYEKLRFYHLNKLFDKIEKCAYCADWAARIWDHDYLYALGKILAYQDRQ